MAQLLYEIKSETSLNQIFDAPDFDTSLLKDCIRHSCRHMLNSFRTDCAQYNPHLNYMKMHVLLKISLVTLCKWMEKLVMLMSSECKIDNEFIDEIGMSFGQHPQHKFHRHMQNIMSTIWILMANLMEIEQVCLRYIEVRFVEKYFKENLLKPSQYELFINFATACMKYAEWLTRNEFFNDNYNNHLQMDVAHGDGIPSVATTQNNYNNTFGVAMCFQCTDSIIKQKYLWIELNQAEKYKTNVELILNVIHMTTKQLLANTNFTYKYENVDLFKSTELNKTSIELYRQAVFVAKFVETRINDGRHTFNIGYSRLQVNYTHT